MQQAVKKLNRVRLKVFDLLEPAAPTDFWSKATDAFLIFLILGNVLAFVVDTVPWVHAKYGSTLTWFTIVSGGIFTIELILRIWSSVEVLHSKDMSYFERRLRFMLRPMQIIDLIVVLSFWLVAFIPYDLRALRMIRILAFARMVRYSPALVALLAVFKTERRSLISSACVLMATIVVAGSVMYYLEKGAQPEVFTDIPTAIYWAATTASTVGYGDISPVTPIGRTFGVIVMLMGVAFAGILFGVISGGFAQQVNQKEFISMWSMITKVPLFSRLEISSLQTIAGLMETRKLKTGEVLYEKDADLNELVIVQAGELLVEADAYNQLLGRNSYFGELALINNRKVKAKISADSDDVSLLVLTRDQFHGLLDSQSEIRDSVETMSRITREGRDDRLVTQAA